MGQAGLVSVGENVREKNESPRGRLSRCEWAQIVYQELRNVLENVTV